MRAGERPPVTEAMLVADGEDVPRLSAIVERQRRELARARADGEAAVVVATARGVLMERQGLSLAEAARQLADMAAAAGLPQPEMAAAVLAEDSGQQDLERGSALREAPAADAPRVRLPGEWLEPGTLGLADDVLAIAAAERAKDGAELVGALAAQLRIRFGAAAAAVWLLDADGALELYGEDGLDGAEASRWRRLPPQFDCPEQRVAVTGADLWWPTGPPAADGVPAAAPWGRGAARALLALRDRSGDLARRCRGLVAGAGAACSTSAPGPRCPPCSPGSPRCSGCTWPTPPSGRRRCRRGSGWRSTSSASQCWWSGRCGTTAARCWISRWCT